MNNKKFIEISITLLLLMLFLIPANNCLAADKNAIYVGGETDGKFLSIQDAINNAQQGDIIYVSNGIYRESIRLYKTVHLIGEEKSSTIIEYNESGETVSITADGCTFKRFTVRNSKGKGYSGINIESDNNAITDNIIENNSDWGIYLYHSSNNVFENNTFINDGINIVGNITGWNTHIIKNNTVNGKKLYFYKNMVNKTISPDEPGQVIISNCTNLTIQDITISNADQGIVLGYSSTCSIINTSVSNSIFGIRLNYASNNTVTENFVGNNDYGIYIIHSNDNMVFENAIHSSKMFGCWICCKSYFNTLYLNNFSLNNKSAYDTFDNQWYKNKIGNYWSDYNGTDADGDGIGDVPYEGILPNGESIDLYPLGFFKTNAKVGKTYGFGLSIALCALVLAFMLKKTWGSLSK